MITRREFTKIGLAALAGGYVRSALAADAPTEYPLARELGVTMSSFARLERDGRPLRYTLLEWPKIFRDELDMRVLDLNSGVITSHEPEYLEQVRRAADDAGCVLTNVKINRSDIDIGHADPAVRRAAVGVCKQWIDTASRLGLRWARPLPLKTQPDLAGYTEAYRELADYGAERKIDLLVENYGWLGADAEAAVKLLREIGRPNVAACPDTGNWDSQEIRYAGLAKLFPLAKTCDFKAGKLGPDGEHRAWDLKRCFTIAWDAGFRGPWCLEHAHTDRDELFRELRLLRDLLRKWTAERDG
jgi:sugar phosphate isomerase/epimerase